jgi:hypothetical protein
MALTRARRKGPAIRHRKNTPLLWPARPGYSFLGNFYLCAVDDGVELASRQTAQKLIDAIPAICTAYASLATL